MNKDQILDQLFDARQVLEIIIKSDDSNDHQRDLALKAIQALWDVDTALTED